MNKYVSQISSQIAPQMRGKPRKEIIGNPKGLVTLGEGIDKTLIGIETQMSVMSRRTHDTQMTTEGVH